MTNQSSTSSDASNEFVQAFSQGASHETYERQWDEQLLVLSPYISLVALFTGFIANVFFYGKGFGINIGLYVIVLLSGGALLFLMLDETPTWKHVIFAIPALVFAGLMSIISNSQLVALNLIVLIGALFVTFQFARIQTFLGGTWRYVLSTGLHFFLVGWLEMPVMVATHTNKRLENVSITNEQVQTVRAIVRGLLITVPVVLLFGILLSSADVVFSKLADTMLSWALPDNAASLIGQMMVIALFTWIGTILYKAMLMPPTDDVMHEMGLDTSDADEPPSPRLALGMIETAMVLFSVNAMFITFTIIQARYLFGGEANISEQGFTYAEYARRGFFEILTVSLMTMALVLFLKAFSTRRPDTETLFRALVTLLIGLTMILLVAAFQRLALYIDAFGFTRLRVMTQVFIIWLGLLFVILVLDVWRSKAWFWYATIAVSMGYILTLNLLNVDAFIAERNIDRFQRTGKVDVGYLVATLSDDAIPEVVRLLDMEIDRSDAKQMRRFLGARLWELREDDKERHWLGYHFGKARALDALESHRNQLAGYIKPFENRYWYTPSMTPSPATPTRLPG